MKLKRLINIIITAICFMGVCIFILPVSYGFYGQWRGRRIQQHILKQDPQPLLIGCRYLIGQRTGLSSDVDYKWLPEGTIVLDPFKRPFTSTVPSVIKDLKPMRIQILNDHIFITMSTMPRIEIVGFATNAHQFGTVKLTDGLWLLTEREGDRNLISTLDK